MQWHVWAGVHGLVHFALTRFSVQYCLRFRLASSCVTDWIAPYGPVCSLSQFLASLRVSSSVCATSSPFLCKCASPFLIPFPFFAPRRGVANLIHIDKAFGRRHERCCRMRSQHVTQDLDAGVPSPNFSPRVTVLQERPWVGIDLLSVSISIMFCALFRTISFRPLPLLPDGDRLPSCSCTIVLVSLSPMWMDARELFASPL